MYSEDERFDKIRSLINKFLYGKQDSAPSDYWEMRSVIASDCAETAKLKGGTGDLSDSIVLNIIDFALFLDLDEESDPNPTTPEEFAKILMIDQDVKRYCQSKFDSLRNVRPVKRAIVAAALSMCE